MEPRQPPVDLNTVKMPKLVFKGGADNDLMKYSIVVVIVILFIVYFALKCRSRK